MKLFTVNDIGAAEIRAQLAVKSKSYSDFDDAEMVNEYMCDIEDRLDALLTGCACAEVPLHDRVSQSDFLICISASGWDVFEVEGEE